MQVLFIHKPIRPEDSKVRESSWDPWSHRTAVLRRILDWFVVDFSCLHLAGDFDGLRDIAGLYCPAKF